MKRIRYLLMCCPPLAFGGVATCLSLGGPLAYASSEMPIGNASSAKTNSRTATLPEQTVAYLEFFHRWDTPQDDAATRMFSRVLRQAPDFKSFQTLAPRGSEERRLFERHLASFEEAAPLIREGQMHEGLFFDAWYAMPSAWNKAKPYVLGMRIEADSPQLYRQFEWLAQRAEQFWSRREKNPPQWKPIARPDPTPEDQAVYAAFNDIWSTPRDSAGRAFFAELQKRAATFDEFSAIVAPGSEEFIKFDRVLCAYDQAGALIKNGILHPKLFFNTWRSPKEIWGFAEPWVKGLRRSGKSPHIYDNVDWLVQYETDWRSNAAR